MTGYGTNLRPKKLLKNGEAAKTLFKHEINLSNGFGPQNSFDEDKIRHFKSSMPRTIHRQDFPHTAAERQTN